MDGFNDLCKLKSMIIEIPLIRFEKKKCLEQQKINSINLDLTKTDDRDDFN